MDEEEEDEEEEKDGEKRKREKRRNCFCHVGKRGKLSPYQVGDVSPRPIAKVGRGTRPVVGL
jgi:hypothetical protein